MDDLVGDVAETEFREGEVLDDWVEITVLGGPDESRLSER